uniref:Uncharacterized protein n=1 Tax=Anguilla anguilla TaxID=7936 RepID=A0A0E9P9A8_ANGAN
MLNYYMNQWLINYIQQNASKAPFNYYFATAIIILCLMHSSL